MLYNHTIQLVAVIKDWIDTNSDLITAAATVVIAIFTFSLWWSTYKMMKVVREQSRDMKASIAVAQKAADAAEKSAKALPDIERAYIFVKITMKNSDAEGIAGTVDKEPQYNHDNVEIIVTNRGKTPALLTGIPYTTKVITDTEIGKYLSECVANIYHPIPSGTAIIDAMTQKPPLPADFFMDKELWKQITIEKAYLTCLGCIHYEDIFGNPHKTIFCWKYEQFTGFHPDPNPERNERT